MKLPRRLRARFRRTVVPPRSAPGLRYGVALLSTILALLPAVVLPDVVESRLVVFAVAVMVSAWYGGWRPGLVATAFAITADAYFALHGMRTEADYGRTVIHLALFTFVALLICAFNAALRSTQEGLRHSDSNSRSLVAGSPYGILRCDAKGRILNANPAFAQMLGYSFSDELVNRSLDELFRHRQEWSTLDAYFSTREGFSDVITELHRKDGSVTVVRLFGRAIRNRYDRTVNFQVFAEDVTERRILERQLHQSQNMEAAGRLAGGIAHDFNNLLMVISGYCEFLLEKMDSTSLLRGPTQEIANATERATALTRQLLAFSRKQMLNPRILDLNAVVSESTKMLTRLIGEDIDLVIVQGTELGAVKADPGQLEQVIINLVLNARGAMPKGGRLCIETANAYVDEVFAQVHTGAVPGDYVKLSVSDTGEAMDADTQAHIFEPFFAAKGKKGAGFGLSTVYAIVKQSGGYVTINSQAGEGTRFEIYLPRVTESGTSASNARPVPTSSPQGMQTILLVEDEPDLRALTCQYLEMQGYEILEAGDGASAVQRCVAHQGTIDLLLTDIFMPGMNGHELAKRILSLRPAIKLLYMSGYADDVVRFRGTRDGALNVLEKPFNLQTLEEKVREVLGSPPQLARKVQDRMPGFRAQRFKLRVPLRYRLGGQNTWHDGTTENISRSGVFFRASERLRGGEQLEINLVLPPEISGLSAVEVVCRGEIVRSTEPEGATMAPAMAAKILHYQFPTGLLNREALLSLGADSETGFRESGDADRVG